MLEVQGVNWVTRKAIGSAAVTLTIKQYTDSETGLTHVDIDQSSSLGAGTQERRVLDWTGREANNPLFGRVQGKTRWATLAELDDDFLKEGFEDGTTEVIHTWTEHLDSGATTQQAWGFEIIDGQRYYVRHVVARKGDQVARIKMVYDWQGKE